MLNSPFYVKNDIDYITTLCIFLKGIFFRNAYKNPHQKQMNKKLFILFGPLVSFVYFWSALSIDYVRDHLLDIPTKWAWWFQRRRLKCKSLRTTTDAKWWLYIAWPFGSSELIRCYQTSHLFRHRGTRNVLPTDVKRAVGLIAATEHTCLLIPRFVDI